MFMKMRNTGNTRGVVSHILVRFRRALGLAALFAFLPISTSSAKDFVIGQSVSAGSRVAMTQIDHEAWDALLQKYVDSRGMVNYRKWKATPEAIKQLDAYIDSLSTAKAAGASKPESLAFWINAYNAITIKGILREYPTSSIRNHTAKLFGYNIWKNLKIRVDGKLWSLDDIEHKVLRKLEEPRIHFAIVCASIGCPKLHNRAYEPEKIDKQLTANAKAFFADPEKFKWSQAKFQLSPILSWFGEDFGSTQAKQLQAIAAYLPEQARPIARAGNVRVSFLGYDWGLNGQQ